MAAILTIVGILGLLTVSSIWRGFVLSVLWAWFVVPLGVPAISIVLAIGISLVVSFLTVTHHETNSDSDWASSITFVILYPLLALFTGWVVHLFL